MARFSNCTVNGVTFSGNNITVSGNRIIVDGKDITPDAKIINIEVTGDPESIQVDNCEKLTVTGSVKNLKTVNGNMEIGGDVTGDVQSVNGNVKCGTVGGKVKTVNGNISHK